MLLKKNNLFKKIIINILILIFLFIPLAVSAQADKYGLGYGRNAGLGTRDVRDTIAVIIKVVLTFLGILMLVLVLYGGLRMLTGAGDPEATASARKIITAAVIGLIIILVAYAITLFVFNVFISAT